MTFKLLGMRFFPQKGKAERSAVRKRREGSVLPSAKHPVSLNGESSESTIPVLVEGDACLHAEREPGILFYSEKGV